jgi:pyruvate dehydrogenase E1 component alpha subunit
VRPEREVAVQPRGPSGVAPPEPPSRWELEYPIRRVMDDNGDAGAAEVALPDAEILQLYRWMLLNRELDERMVGLQRQGRIGFYVGSIGEEAAIHGAAAAMKPGDWIFPAYREHGAALQRGMPLAAFLCGLLGNSGDRMLGHQMPCHEAWRAANFVSVSSPIATQIPQAVGAAWAARLKNHDMVALAFFGDGATSSGDFHAGLNFAGVHRLPVIFLCRNNGWAISMPRERQTASETIVQKAIAYGMAGERVDGNDLLAVHDVVRRARVRAASGEGPTLVECLTYRLEGHSTSDDPRAYREPRLVEEWRKRDPLLRLRAFLRRRGSLSELEERQLLEEVRGEIQRALREAESAAPRPPIETLIEGVYSEPLRQQREQLEELRAAVAADPRVTSAQDIAS